MSDKRQPAAYIMASDRHGTPYVGVTSNLLHRVEAANPHWHDLYDSLV